MNLFIFQGWLNTRPTNEQAVIFDLFENSFPFIYRQAIQSYVWKIDVLEAFVISQVSTLELSSCQNQAFFSVKDIVSNW